MHSRRIRTFALVLIASLVLTLAVPALVAAKPAPKGIRPQYVVPGDAYESDNTSATARVFGVAFGEESVHTLSGLDDEDWVRISVTETDQPFVLETQAYPSGAGQAWFDSEIQVWRADPALDGGLEELTDFQNDDSEVWDGYGSTVYFIAPEPGTYYVQVYMNSEGNNGRYKLFISPGISRRIGGSNRFDTAAQLSRTLYPDMSNPWSSPDLPDGVVLVNGASFADALSAGAWGASGPFGSYPYPVLLTTRDFVPEPTLAEVVRLAQADWWDGEEFTIYVVGGKSGVSDAQIASLKTLPYVKDVVRIAGDNRFETAAAVADYMAGNAGAPAPLRITPQREVPGTVVLVNGYKWPDGVAAGSLCGSLYAPILLSTQTTLTPATREWLYANADDVKNVLIVGNTSSVGTDVADALQSGTTTFTVERVGGDNRYQTAYQLAAWGVENGYLDPSGITLVTGESFPDGLAAGPFSMLNNDGYYYGPGPILLTRKAYLSAEVEDFWMDYGDTSRPSYVIGSTGAISADTEVDFDDLWQMDMMMPTKK